MIRIVGQSVPVFPETPTVEGVALPHPPVEGIRPGDVLFAAEFLGGRTATKTGWNQTDTPPGPDPYPGNPDNQWGYPPQPTLGTYNPTYWMDGAGAFWHPFKVWKGTETARSVLCERMAARGWQGITSADPRFGHEGLFVCGALRGVDPANPIAYGLRFGSGMGSWIDAGATYLGPTGERGARWRYTPNALEGALPSGVIGKRALWIFACEWTGAQEILNNLRPLTWGAFDGQVTYETLYFGSAGGDAFQHEAEGRTFGYATGVAVLTSPLPSNVIPDCEWLLRCTQSGGSAGTAAGPFGTMLILNDLPPVADTTYPTDTTWEVLVPASEAPGTFEAVASTGETASVTVTPDWGLPLTDSASNTVTPIRHTATGKILAIRRSA